MQKLLFVLSTVLLAAGCAAAAAQHAQQGTATGALTGGDPSCPRLSNASHGQVVTASNQTLVNSPRITLLEPIKAGPAEVRLKRPQAYSSPESQQSLTSSLESDRQKSTQLRIERPAESISRGVEVPKAAVGDSQTDLQPVPTVLANSQLQPITLVSAIQHSIATKRIFNSFNGEVVVEQLSGFDQEIAGQNITAELAKFDPTLTANLAGNHIDRPTASFFGPGLSQTTRRDEAEFNARLSRVWSAGTTASIGYEPSLAYLFFPNGSSSAFNPIHSSDLVIRATQPLMRGRGAQVNLATVRIAETKWNQTRIGIEATMQAQLRSIEAVYWKLHANHVRLQAINEAIFTAQQIYKVSKDRFDGERALYSDVARAAVRLEELYQQKLSIELDIQNSTLDLAQLVGLELTDAVVLAPTDSPEFRQPKFDAGEITASAINNNLAIQARRAEISIRQNDFVLAKNQLLPQFDLLALHRTSGLNDNLGDSLQQMSGLEFNDFTLGLQYTQQLGYRKAKSRSQVARLELARETAILQAAERQLGFEILQLLNELKQSYGRYESARRQFEQAQKWVAVAKQRYDDPPLNITESMLVLLLDYQAATQAKIDAISLVARTLAEYNTNLAVVEEKRGGLLDKWRISMGTPDPAPLDSGQQP